MLGRLFFIHPEDISDEAALNRAAQTHDIEAIVADIEHDYVPKVGITEIRTMREEGSNILLVTDRSPQNAAHIFFIGPPPANT